MSKSPSKACLDEIRRYCDTYSGSSDVEKIEHVLAELDRLTLDRDEARAQQAHTASCNIELMRKLDHLELDLDRFASLNSDLIDEKAKLSKALRFYANVKNYGTVLERGVVIVNSPAPVYVDVGEKARKALGDSE